MSTASPEYSSGCPEDAAGDEVAASTAAPLGAVACARAWAERSLVAKRAAGVYRRFEHAGAALFFFGGVAWDAATLTRIDLWLDNAFLLGYLLMLGALIVVTILAESGTVASERLTRYAAWYPAAIQFFMGALFSAYVVYYSQSATLAPTSLFLLVLVGLLVANEFLHRRLTNLYLLVALYFMACLTFFIFFIPVVVGQIGYAPFLAAGLVSLVAVGAMLMVLYRRGVFERLRQLVGVALLVSVLFGAMNLFYLRNWIPPVPLALRAGGVYHDVRWQGDDFRLTYERPPWFQFWQNASPVFHRVEGAPVYCFAAVFAPTDLTERLYHEWQFLDEDKEEWLVMDRIGYRINGGRGQGFRGFTVKRHVPAGRWRVDIRTTDDLLVGRIRFRVRTAAAPPDPLATRLYE